MDSHKAKIGNSIQCQYHGCDKLATMKFDRANTYLCDKHIAINKAAFPCDITVTRLLGGVVLPPEAQE